MNINRITVVGANGTLGIGVSSIFASFGDAKVYMVARSIEKARDSVSKAAKAVKAYSICSNLIPETYENIQKCIEDSDLIIETIVEEYDKKEEIHKLINKYMRKDSIASTVTSGISINKISKCYNEENRNRFMGLHFFNPPYNLQLCELIPAKETSKHKVKEVEQYLTEVLNRKVIITKDEAAFLANRIGFHFINKAMQYAKKYENEGGIDYIDAILGCFTGRNMPPLATADFVGLDVHKAIVDNIYENTNDYEHESFKLIEYVEDLVKQGMLGDKSNGGLYRLDRKQVFDIKTKKYREVKEYRINFIENVIEKFKNAEYEEGIRIILEDNSKEAKICAEFLINYITYALLTEKEVAKSVYDCDIAMAEGFNWIPPYALIEIIGENKCKALMRKRWKGNKEIIEELFKREIKSKYQYEKYLKAKR